MKASQHIRAGLRLLGAKLRGGRFPLQAHIRVIDSCNLRCLYCFGDYPVRNLPPPSTSQLVGLIAGLKRLGTARITLTGGEPTLREDIVEIARRANRSGIAVSLTTNGSLLPEKAELLRSLDQLTVSLDGDEEVHDANRGRGSHRKALAAIELARSRDVSVQLLCTINRLTRTGLTDVFDCARRYGCSVTFDLLAPLYGPGGALAPREQAAADERIREIIRGIRSGDLRRLVLSRPVINYILNWPVSYSSYYIRRADLPGGFKPIPCSAGRYFAMVETDGSLYPCCRIAQDYEAPNVYRVGVETAWKNMKPHGCAACCSAGFSMFNSLMALEPGSLGRLLGIR
jgi:MoaA/NifB/PqqE/SkfB family radical SAM enzyme